MPQKKNPDILELTRGKTAEIIGNLVAILSTVKGLASGYGRDLQQIKSAVWSSSKTSISAILVLKSILLTMRVNEKQMKKATESGYLVALDVAETLVQKGVPFRTAHKIAGGLVKLAHDGKKRLNKLTKSEISRTVKGTGADADFVLDVVEKTSISSSLKARKSLGSSGYEEQERMIKDRIKKINSYRTITTKIENDISKSLDEMALRVQKLTG